MKKKLHLNLNNSGGRNNKGQITMYTIGGGVKKKYRLIDFKRFVSKNCFSSFILLKSNLLTFNSSSSILKLEENKNIINSNFAFVLRLEKDPNRSAYIALICFPNGILSYIIAAEKMKIGMKIFNFEKANVNININIPKNNQSQIYFEKNKDNLKHKNLNYQSGNNLPLNLIPNGFLINNIELYPLMGSVLNRSAGVWAQIIKTYNEKYIQIKLKSGEHRLIHKDCRATLGIVSNIYNNQNKLIKAGQSRLLNRRPIVRGRAMNPVDHPHGGRTNGGTFPKTPWGFLTKNRKTRNNFKTNNFIVIKRLKTI